MDSMFTASRAQAVTAEERARTLCRDFNLGSCVHRPQTPPCSSCQEWLASIAIRAAEDAAFERAAQAIDCDEGCTCAFALAAKEVRALKSTPTPKE